MVLIIKYQKKREGKCMKNVTNRVVRILLILVTIGCLSIPSTSYAWGSDGHSVLVENAMNKMQNTYGHTINFSGSELELLYYCADLPDQAEYRDLALTSSLHGRGNYLSCEKYLWELAMAMLETKGAASLIDATFLSNYLNSRTYLTPSEKSRMATVNTKIEQLITTKLLYQDDYELSKRKKAIKVIGFMCHLIGDTYAHNTFFPLSSVDYLTYDSTLNFRKQDFPSDSKYSDTLKWNTFKEIITNYNVTFADSNKMGDNDIRAYKRDENSTPVNFFTEKIYPLDLLNAISANLNSQFEDNPNFHATRINATFTVTRRFLTDFNAAINLYSSGQDFSAYRNYNINHTNYYEGTGYQLRNFDAYKNIIK